MKKTLLMSIAIIGIITMGSVFANGFNETTVMIPSGDHEIPAILTMPDGAAEVPAVLLIHGFGSVKDEVGDFYMRLASELANSGYASLRFDFPGSGDSQLSFTANTVDFQIAEATTALEWLLKQKRVDASRIGILGFSLGGIVASSMRGTYKKVKALALWSTPGNTPEAFMDLYTAYYQKACKDGHVVVDLGWRTVDLSREFFESLFGSFPLNDIRGYNGPLLVVAGALDLPQPEYAREFVMNAGSDDVTMRIIKGADHTYNVLTEDQTDSEKVIEITQKWFEEKL